MSHGASGHPRPAVGRLDPSVRGLLRAFISPEAADKYASALQPIAVADRDAAIAGAVSALRVRYAVPADAVAVALVEDTGWDVHDAATIVGLPVAVVAARLERPDELRTPEEPTALDDDPSVSAEAAAVDAMLSAMPVRRVDAAIAAALADEPVAVELSTSLPAFVGMPGLEDRFAQADRSQRRAVNVTILAIVLLLVLAVLPTGSTPATDPDAVDLQPGLDELVDDAPTEEVTPPAVDDIELPEIPTGTPVIGLVLFVDAVDPQTGEAGTTLETAGLHDEVRAFVSFDQLPPRDVLVSLTFTAPDTGRTVRPVLLPEGFATLSVRLPDELGRLSGRYQVEVEAEGAASVVAEVILVEPAA